MYQVIQKAINNHTKNLIFMKAHIKTLANDYTFLNFYNSKEVYSRKGFDTARKAKNYAKKYNIELTETLPDNIDINIF